MSILIDISHPAHFHFFCPLVQALIADGVAVHIVARTRTSPSGCVSRPACRSRSCPWADRALAEYPPPV